MTHLEVKSRRTPRASSILHINPRNLVSSSSPLLFDRLTNKMSSVHVFHAFLPSDSSSESPNLIPSKDKNGCWICRFRKKTCKTYDENGPDYDASDKRCFDCKKFNIVCCGQSADRPSVRSPFLCSFTTDSRGLNRVRASAKRYETKLVNRRTCVPPLDLSYLWQPPGELAWNRPNKFQNQLPESGQTFGSNRGIFARMAFFFG